ncbi:hypothetical protein DYI24_25090 [Rhodopseudomonas sp. BR0C11]|nr:hypothetical protein [Rhodopseudomonas sp. BR0C11]
MAATPVVVKSVGAEHARRSSAGRRLQGNAGTRAIILQLVIEQRRAAMPAPTAFGPGAAQADRLGAVAVEVDDVSEIRVYDFFNHAVLVAYADVIAAN